MLYREIIAVCSEIRREHINAMCGQNVEFVGAFAKITKSDCYRGELSYLAPLGSEKISAPYFKQCFFREEGGYYPQTESNTTPPSPKTEVTYILFYILSFVSVIQFKI
jgi:hypothetical protein